MAGSRRHSSEEAEGLLYSEEHHHRELEKPTPSQRRLRFLRLVRVAIIVLAIGLLVWIILPRSTRQIKTQHVDSLPAASKSSTSAIVQPSTSATIGTQAVATDSAQSADNLNDDESAVACGFAACLTKRFTYEKVKSFELRNYIEPTERGDLFRNSWVRLEPGLPGQQEDIVVDVSFNTTDAVLSGLLDMRQQGGSLLMLFPAYQPPSTPASSATRQFIETQTKIYLRAGLKLNQITIESSILGINIPEPIDIWTDAANFTCTAGSLMADPMINARYAFVTMEAGTILGTFPLYEALAFESDAGRISAKIVPQDHKKAHGIHAARASLIVQSTAGDVDIHYKTKHGVPVRDYTIHVQTDFGRITGKYLHGSYTALQTVMGDIDAKILPMAADRDESELITYTHAGRQQIELLEPLDRVQNSGARLARLEASHESKLGSLDVIYPAAWEGSLEAVSRMGAVELDDGKAQNALQIIREQRSLLGVLVEAQKGQGAGSVVCGTERGDVRFSVAA